MKIIEIGTVPTYRKQRPWYLVITHECPRCGAKWQLEDDDDFIVKSERCVNGSSYCTSVCPTHGCNTKVETGQPLSTGGRVVGTSDWDGQPLKGDSQ